MDIIKILLSKGTLKTSFGSWTLRRNLIEFPDHSLFIKELQNLSKEHVLTIFLMKNLEQGEEELVNVELIKYLINMGVKIDKYAQAS